MQADLCHDPRPLETREGANTLSHLAAHFNLMGTIDYLDRSFETYVSGTFMDSRNSYQQIAIFLPSLNGGGAERAMVNLANGLVEHGYPVDLVLAQASGPYLDLVKPDVRLVNLAASRVITSLPSLTHYLRHERPAAILSALDYANIIALWARWLARSSVKAVVNEHNTISRTAPNSARKRQRLVPSLIKRFYPWADAVVAVSQGVADDLEQKIGLHHPNLRVIYNAVITPDMRLKAACQPDHPWFAPGSPPVILGVGRLTVQKDFPTLIQAFAQVRRHHSARLMILGEGPDRPMLEELVTSLNLKHEIALPGFVDNPYAYMHKAALLALSSRWEGLPTVLIEALFCGTAVVATDCPSGSREILADGKFGRLVPVGNVTALAAAIEESLLNDCPRPGQESWYPYSLEAIVEEFAKLLLGHA